MRFDLEMIRRDVEMFFLDLPDADKLRVPPKHLYFFRLYWGMFAVLARLGAVINWRRTAQEVLEELGIEP